VFSYGFKRVKIQKYNLDIKEIVLDRCLNGESSVSLGKEFGILQNTIQTWGKKIKYLEKYLKLGKRGKPKEKDLTKKITKKDMKY